MRHPRPFLSMAQPISHVPPTIELNNDCIDSIVLMYFFYMHWSNPAYFRHSWFAPCHCFVFDHEHIMESSWCIEKWLYSLLTIVGWLVIDKFRVDNFVSCQFLFCFHGCIAENTYVVIMMAPNYMSSQDQERNTFIETMSYSVHAIQ